MAKIVSHHSSTTLLFFFFLLISKSQITSSCFSHIYSFGDSITDTGNLMQILGNQYSPVQNLPYGETYFGRATGRFSDGRLIIDFLAQEYKLPLLPAYLVGKNVINFRHGVNFAVAGATARNNYFFEEKGVHGEWPDYALDVQLKWFKKLLPSILLDSGSNDIMNSSLFLLGEIGGIDYNAALILNGRNTQEAQKYIPLVIQTIGAAIEELITFEAKTIMVPGMFPLGCLPVCLTMFMTEDKEDYDSETGCIKWLNDFAEYHNVKLNEELDRLRKLYPNLTIIYADYFGAMMNVYRNPKKFGIDNPLIACCGGEGPYHTNLSIKCGEYDSIICSDPSQYVSWDGVHFTEAAYKIIADAILHDSYTSPPLSQACSNSNVFEKYATM